MSENNNNKGSNTGAIITGVIIGAALTYLFGTKSGRKVRDQLIAEGQKLLDKMGEGLEETKDKLEESKPVEKLEEKAQAVKEEVEQAAEEVPKHIAEIQKKGRRFFFHRSRSPES